MEKRILTGAEMADCLRKKAITTKAEIAIQMEKKIAKHAAKLKESSSEDGYETLLTLMLISFLGQVEKAILFDVLPDEWVYSFDLSYDEFALNMEHVKQVDVDLDGKYSGYTCDAVYKLININPDSVSIEKYCQLHKLAQGTVRQWIRRGKIRTAKKIGNEWQIPLLTPVPSRGYEPAQYKWPYNIAPESLPNEYKFLCDYVLATFYQDRKEKSKFHVLLVCKETITSGSTGKNKELLLNAKDREKLELFMIAHPQIKYCGSLI